MKNIFISYSRDDLKMVENEIIPEIKKIRGSDCWFDFDCIETGADSFKEEIKKGIENSFIFILVLSESVMHKEWPFREFSYAELLREKDSSRKTIWLKLDDSDFAGYFESYKNTEKDIIFWNKPRELQKMTDHIRGWIKNKAISLFEEGIKKEKSISQDAQNDAFSYFIKSAEMGFAEAQAKVGYYYHIGKNGVKPDRAKAIEWCKKGCNQDCPNALSLMSRIFKNDKATRIQYLNEAANKNQKYAQFCLGKEYYSGALSPDIISAIYWLKKASDQNEPNAQKLLGHILKKEFVHQEKLAKEYLCKAESNQNKK